MAQVVCPAVKPPAGQRQVEPWVMWRYTAMVAYGLLMMLTVTLLPLRGLILQAPALAALQVLLAIVALLL